MAMYEAKGTLLRLSDRDFLMADSAEDIRGRMVLHSAREDLGEVDDLFIDDYDHRWRFLEVSSGGFWGIVARNLCSLADRRGPDILPNAPPSPIFQVPFLLVQGIVGNSASSR